MKSQTIIMIVDDDDDDRMLFEEAVHEVNPGVKCICACNGAEAFELLMNIEGKLPDLIFLDLNMPGIPGKQFLARMKRDANLKNIPVIIYSTSQRPEDFNETRRLGALNFVVKPTTFEDICKIVKESLKEIQLRKSHSNHG